MRRFVNSQVTLCNGFDKLLPEKFRVDGYSDFRRTFAPGYLKPGLLVYDVGGGKNPAIDKPQKDAFSLRVIGLDISRNELLAAPDGAYDEMVCEDISKHRGRADGDLVICQALLEHVSDTDAALSAISSILKQGGVAVLFVPSRNAIYARLNLLTPHSITKRILYTVFPDTKTLRGYRAYYDRCTPRDFRSMAHSKGFETLELRPYFLSPYFSFFFPLHVAWRIWIILFYCFAGEQAAETFSIALRKT